MDTSDCPSEHCVAHFKTATLAIACKCCAETCMFGQLERQDMQLTGVCDILTDVTFWPHLPVIGVDSIDLILHICILCVDGSAQASTALHEVPRLAEMPQEFTLHTPTHTFLQFLWLFCSAVEW